MKNSKGFGLYGLLAVIVVAGVASFAVWRVTSTKDKDDSKTTTTAQQQSTQQQTTEPATETPVDPTADWQSHTDPTFKYTVKYPKDWVRHTDNPENCSEGLTMLAPTPDSLGRCGSDFGGRVMVVAAKQSDETSYAMTKAMYPDLATTDVTANGVAGKKYTGTVPASEEIGVGPEVGSVVIHYVFVKDGKEFALLYTEAPKATNLRETVEQIVTKGFSF